MNPEHLLSPLLDALTTEEDVRQALVDWMVASWLRTFEPAEALDLAMAIIAANDHIFTIEHIPELITRTMFRTEQLMKSPEPKGAAEGLMVMLLDVHPEYLTNLQSINARSADGEG